MAKKQFKAESKKLLDLMINSIYTNSEIFLRELISNASDALDKRYYLSLTDANHKVSKKDLTIRLEVDKENRTLVIEDTGIGMNKEEMETNLGTIAKSGSEEFKAQLEKATKNIDIIGQFGVGFYSAFMVGKKIVVDSKSSLSEEAYRWESQGIDGYQITKIDKDSIGTRITIYLKDDTEEKQYSDYLEEWKIKELVHKYSDYVRYPIQMEVTKQIPDPTDDTKTISTKELETLNSMIPLWKKNKNKISKEDYNEFYKSKFNDWVDPQKVIHYSVEGNLSYTALLFIPSETPYNFYNTDFESGLQLYSKGVFIMDKAKDLLPESYRFVTGLVDSEDLSLNISRELLQQDHQVKALASSLEKKIHNALEDMLKNEREEYEKFFDHFGLNLKYDLYKSYGMHQEQLKDLLLYKSSKENRYVTLKEYVEGMPKEQEKIYYACGSNLEEIAQLPALAKVKEKGYEILYLTDSVDEFAISMLNQYEGKPFQSITKGDLGLDSEEEKKAKEEQTEANKDLLTAMKDALKDEVKEVRISSRLLDAPVCLIAEDGLSLEMERILSHDPANAGVKATKILEINPNHPIFKALQKVYQEDPKQLEDYASVLLNQARLIEGLPIENPVEYTNKITELMIRNAN
ncbi:MAG: molecular chaperone HtpG [Solobacterium sp.]|nr:molecular chaperone HtpG [Solobacterium sp.]